MCPEVLLQLQGVQGFSSPLSQGDTFCIRKSTQLHILTGAAAQDPDEPALSVPRSCPGFTLRCRPWAFLYSRSPQLHLKAAAHLGVFAFSCGQIADRAWAEGLHYHETHFLIEGGISPLCPVAETGEVLPFAPSCPVQHKAAPLRGSLMAPRASVLIGVVYPSKVKAERRATVLRC